MASRMDQLAGVAASVPGLNEKARGQASAAQDIMVQKAVGGGGKAQDIAAAAATSAGQSAFAQKQKEQGVASQIGQAALGAKKEAGTAKVEEKAMTQREQLAREAEAQAAQLSREALQSRKTITQKEIDTSRELQLHGVFMDNNLQIASIQQRKDLSALGGKLEDKLLYSRLKFSEDERGRRFTNDRQMADYLISNSATNQEFNGYMKKIKQQSDRQMQVLRASHAQLQQTLNQGYLEKKGDLDRETQLEIAQAKKAIEERIAKERKKAKARASQWSAGGQVVGAVVGAVVVGVATGGTGTAAGFAAGASAGAAVGGGVGSMIGSQQ